MNTLTRLVSVLLLLLALDAFADSRPNILVIVVDDMRADDFSAGGQPFVDTPGIDRLAEEGVLFRNAFTTSPLCSPARASLLTGQYARNHGIVDNSDRGPASHRLRTFAMALQDEGYDTAFIGKWHMGRDGSRRPGFDTWVSLIGQGVNVDPEIIEGETKRTVEGHVTDVFTDRAVAFAEKERDQPFLLYLAHKAMHPNPAKGLLEGGYIAADRHRGAFSKTPVPRSPSAGVPPLDKPALMREHDGLPPLGMDTSTTDRTIRYRMEMMLGVDESTSRLIDTLERSGQLENTVVIFTSDHGYFYGEHGLNPQRRLAYEEAIRIPLLIRYPSMLEAGTVVDQHVLNLDIAPTVLELAGLSAGAHIDGLSLLPLLTGEKDSLRDSFLIEYQAEPEEYLTRARQRTGNPSEFERVIGMEYDAVRNERYKYIRYSLLEGMDELYDLHEDPFEMRNLAGDASAAEILKSMQRALDDAIAAAGSR